MKPEEIKALWKKGLEDLGKTHDLGTFLAGLTPDCVIHTTYGIAIEMQKYLKDSRIMWHTQLDKEAQYHAFRQNKKNAVLVCSGMSEGIDLAGDFGRFQIISKIQFPSLSEPLIVAKKNEIPDFYTWETIRLVSQQYGRICRDPQDTGITYVLDSDFNILWNRKDLFPEWILDARYKIAPDDFRKLMKTKIEKAKK